MGSILISYSVICSLWCENKIQMKLVLLRELSKMEPGGPWESVISAISADWMESSFWPHIFLRKASRISARSSRYLSELTLKKTSYQPSLKDKYFLSCVTAQLPGFCLYKPLTLSLPWDTLFGFTQICVSGVEILFCLSLYWICCNIASMVFGFFGQELWESLLPNQGSNLHPLFWKAKS